ncbi:hypothetical protein BH18THE1_BH18THE1_08270 [soil metagenome]
MPQDRLGFKYRGITHVMNSLLDIPPNSHTVLVYPNLNTIREIYRKYSLMVGQKGTEMFIILPYYETVEDVKRNLMVDDNCFETFEVMLKEGSLIIRDCHAILNEDTRTTANFLRDCPSGVSAIAHFLKEMLTHATKIGKDTVSVWIDTGTFRSVESGHRSLFDYEQFIPLAFNDEVVKQFCLYHQKDFELKLSQLEEHKSLIIIKED